MFGRATVRIKGSHLLLAAAAILCGTMAGLTHLLGIMWAGSSYSPFAVEDAHIIIFDETVAYAAPTRAAVEGAPLTRAPQGPKRFEEQGGCCQALGRLFPTVIMSGLARIVGVSHVFVLSNVLFPALLFLAVFLFARSLGLSRIGGLCAATFVMLGDQILNLPAQVRTNPEWAIRHTILAVENPRPLECSRTWVPQFSYLVLLLAIWAVWRCMTEEGNKWIVLAGVLLALNAYTYAYSWPVAFGGTAILALLLSATDRRATVRIIIAIGLGTVLASPVLIEVLRGTGGADMARYGSGISGLVWGAQKPRIILTVALLLAYPWHRPERPLVHSFLVVPWACALGSTLTGFMLQDWH